MRTHPVDKLLEQQLLQVCCRFVTTCAFLRVYRILPSKICFCMFGFLTFHLIRYNIVFLLSGGGKFNYLGTRKWLEDQIENSENSVLNEVDYVLCLDSIGGSNQLFMHVSKPPKENSPGFKLVEAFNEVGGQYPDVNFTLVHKKVNLADEIVAWEHERFSLRRLAAGTLSHFSQPKDSGRTSMFQTK